jgi:hypothetical protein
VTLARFERAKHAPAAAAPEYEVAEVVAADMFGQVAMPFVNFGYREANPTLEFFL